MSIVCKEVDTFNFETSRRLQKYLEVTIDPATTNQLPFPSNYKYFSCMLPAKYLRWADRLQNFKIRKDDIWILGFPKSGTTWTQNIVDQLKIKNMNFNEYFHPDTNFFEMPIAFERVKGDSKFAKFVENNEKMIDELDAQQSPRMIKSHLPAYLLPKEIWTVQPKMIYVSREVKDMAVSLFHMNSECMHNFTGTASEFFKSMRSGFYKYYEHIYSYKQLRHLEHILFTTYEDLSRDTFGEIKRISKFLDCSYSDEQLQRLVDHVSFGNMRKNITSVATNDDFIFCRKGKVGGYRDELSKEEIRLFDEWTARKTDELERLCKQ